MILVRYFLFWNVFQNLSLLNLNSFQNPSLRFILEIFVQSTSTTFKMYSWKKTVQSNSCVTLPATRTTYWSLGLISSMLFFRVVLKSPKLFCSVSVKSVSSWSMNFSVLIKSSKSLSRFIESDFLASERISYVCRWKQNNNNNGIAGIYIKISLRVRQQLKYHSSSITHIT